MDQIQAIRNEITAHTIAVRQATVTIGLAVPAVWGMAELRAHYTTWSEDRIKAELKARVGIKVTRGHRIEVHVSKVREIDAQLIKEARMQGVLSTAGKG